MKMKKPPTFSPPLEGGRLRGGKTSVSFEVFKRRKALNMFFVGGFPDIEKTSELLKLLPKLGCDIVEVGVPYSDPLADGSVIRTSYSAALARGITLDGILKTIKAVRKDVPVPIVLLIYENLIMKKGEDVFIREMAECGVNGVIVPDLLFPFSNVFADKCRDAAIAFIPLVSPKTSLARVEKISERGGGFLYYVNVEGVMGERRKLPENIKAQLKKIKSSSKLPVLSGFGISRPSHIKSIKKYVDGVIIGSALQKRINAGQKIEGFVREMRCSL